MLGRSLLLLVGSTLLATAASHPSPHASDGWPPPELRALPEARTLPPNTPDRGGSGTDTREAELERIERLLDDGRWAKADKLAQRAAQEVAKNTWERSVAGPLLARLSLYRAVAKSNSDDPAGALWHWYTAVALRPAIGERPLEGWGPAAELSEHPMRRRDEMPPGLSAVDDIARLRLEQVEIQAGDGPTVDNPTAARRGPHGDLQVEVVVERDGSLHAPLVLSEAAHPVLVFAVLDWLFELSPARPAHLDGEPVDSLYRVTIDFDTAWSRGGLILDPGRR